MVKKEVIEKKEKTSNIQEGPKIERVLVENFVSLQHVITNLAVKFDNLSSQISKLLELFEISAKALAEKGTLGEERTDKKAVEKLDSLLEQNKIIAKGIALLHERNSPQPQYTIAPQNMRPIQPMLQQRPPYEFPKNSKIRK